MTIPVGAVLATLDETRQSPPEAALRPGATDDPAQHRPPAAAPAAVHLIASGSVVQADDDARWALFDDFAWLLALARKYKILVLSGDIHANRFKSIDLGDGHWLHDATASGAAVCKLVSVGSKCQNYGLLTTDPATLRLDFFSHGTPDSVGAWAIDRQTWGVTSV